jgi:sialate O-acetylesterase
LSSFLLAGVVLCAAPLHADVKLASPFGSHMVLQREMKVPVWGTADAGEDVTVEFAGQKKNAKAGNDGAWRTDLDPLTASADGKTLTVTGSKTSAPLTLDDVLVGEVWLASGQSNMVFPVEASGPYHGLINYEGEIAAAKYPQIRLFTARDTKSYTPQNTVTGSWVVCSPETIGTQCAVGYVFARDLFIQLKVPVGVVVSASGASCAEAWISRETLTADASLKPYLDVLDACYAYFKADPATRPAVAPLPPTPINKPRGGGRGGAGDPSRDQHMPTVLFNGMIKPLIPFAIRGAIWYQGESIVGGTPGLNLYGHIMQTLIKDWRAQWGEGDLPFYLVQLPGQENISNNPRIREEQQTVLALPNTGFAVTIDTGEQNNVHPSNKAPVGYRLSLIALANAYHQNIEYSGPLYQSMNVKNNTAIIHFTHLGAGLKAKDGAFKGFQIAGADKNFVDATAQIDGDTLVISSPQVSAPVAVRYAWANFPEGLGCNLYNSYDLPAAPFRTDQWDYPIKGIVEN